MLRPDQIERLRALGKEQLAIAEKWDKEKEAQNPLFDELIELATVAGTKDSERFHELVEQLSDVPTHCEHERSIWSACAGCEEIEMALNPEFYDENGDRLPDEEIDDLVEANPERYNLPPKP